MDAAFGVAWNGFLTRFHLAPASLAYALLFGTLAALPLLWFGGQALARWPKRPPLIAVALTVVAVVWSLILTPGAATFLISVAALLIVTAALDAAASGAALDLEARSGVRLLGKVQSGFAVGAVSGAALSGFLVGNGNLVLLGVIILAWVTLLLLGLWRMRIPTPAANLEGEEAQLPRARASTLALIGAAAVIAYYAEGMMLSWSGVFLQRDLGLSAHLSGLLSSGYYVAFGVGALLSSTLLTRLGARRSMRLLSLVAAIGGLMLVSAAHILVAAAGMLLLGAAVAGLMPTLLSWAANLGLGAGAAGFVSTFAYLGMVLEPVTVSLGGESLRPALMSLPALLLLMGALTYWRPAGQSRSATVAGAWD
ncbi:fucose permease [Deinobacterium chartae]|uniref:Fucose permease n=1 Tax=Deinobacterium chartae TaxID=521158 RepID=A0A841HY99_9DEIO|nr:MFS transporter [Deinobacterium chartae]MBB6096892.1 fucose permease [Deinobacterium chartae]